MNNSRLTEPAPTSGVQLPCTTTDLALPSSTVLTLSLASVSRNDN